MHWELGLFKNLYGINERIRWVVGFLDETSKNIYHQYQFIKVFSEVIMVLNRFPIFENNSECDERSAL